MNAKPVVNSLLWVHKMLVRKRRLSVWALPSKIKESVVIPSLSQKGFTALRLNPTFFHRFFFRRHLVNYVCEKKKSWSIFLVCLKQTLASPCLSQSLCVLQQPPERFPVMAPLPWNPVLLQLFYDLQLRVCKPPNSTRLQGDQPSSDCLFWVTGL